MSPSRTVTGRATAGAATVVVIIAIAAAFAVPSSRHYLARQWRISTREVTPAIPSVYFLDPNQLQPNPPAGTSISVGFAVHSTAQSGNGNVTLIEAGQAPQQLLNFPYRAAAGAQVHTVTFAAPARGITLHLQVSLPAPGLLIYYVATPI